jgi:hypothetical protein
MVLRFVIPIGGVKIFADLRWRAFSLSASVG